MMRTLADYINEYKSANSRDTQDKAAATPTLSIALLASATLRGVREVLGVKGRENGIRTDLYEGPYNQYTQEILNPASGLYQSHPALVILFIDTRALLGDLYFRPYIFSDEERKVWVKEKTEELAGLVSTLKNNTSAKILLHNFEVPHRSPLGILENKQSFGFIESIETLNAGLRDLYKKDPQIFIFDYNAFASRIGADIIMDHKLYYLGDLKIAPQHIPALCDEYLSYIKPLAARTKKCLVLDLDNTLWGGVLGEDGLEGIHLGPTPEGRPYWEFQKHLLALFNRGVILAVNSKNNLEDALEALRMHPYMILREEHFASIQANWDNKAINIERIADELDIGIDSLVFFDDDPLNRSIVRDTHPDVVVVEVPDDPALYTKTLADINDFNTLQLTSEDWKKGVMYAEQRKRKEYEKKTVDMTDYLRKLKTVVTIEGANDFTIPRIAQLTQKTNQFTMTTRRYQEEAIRAFIEHGYLVASIRVEDSFGDSGTTGVIIVERGKKDWRIDSFLLSCRVIGRRVEETLLAYILEKACKAGAKRLIGEFIPTKKNAPAMGFYERSGFLKNEITDDIERYVYDVQKPFPYPEFIQIKIT